MNHSNETTVLDYCLFDMQIFLSFKAKDHFLFIINSLSALLHTVDGK